MESGGKSVTIQMRSEIIHGFGVALAADRIETDETAGEFLKICNVVFLTLQDRDKPLPSEMEGL
jgi:hypothetical protein